MKVTLEASSSSIVIVSTSKFGDEPFSFTIPLLVDPVIVADPDEPEDPLEPEDPDEPDEPPVPDEPDEPLEPLAPLDPDEPLEPEDPDEPLPPSLPDCANINPHWVAPPNGIASEVVKGVTPRVQ
tara:strand:- start:53 stop:427 length:375 start_codon:yes stop_codon:yes gene_type:complete